MARAVSLRLKVNVNPLGVYTKFSTLPVVRQILDTKTHDPIRPMFSQLSLDKVRRFQYDPLFVICKRSIMCRSAELTRPLLEWEDQVNIYAQLPLPMLCLFGGFFLYFWQSRFAWHPWWTISPLAVLAAAIFLFVDARIIEELDCYEMFLLLESDLARKPSDAKLRQTAAEAVSGLSNAL